MNHKAVLSVAALVFLAMTAPNPPMASEGKRLQQMIELSAEREDYRARKAVEDENHSCLCQKAGESSEDCPWKCPIWSHP